MTAAPEIVIVGGGIGGGALATVLAREGQSVAVLERDIRAVDRVRGEFMAPWGVAEAVSLGLLDVLLGTGGVFATRFIGYDENIAPDSAEASVRDMRAMHPVGTGPLCSSHPAMCEALCAAANAAGAAVLRGVGGVAIAAGEPPSISFEHEGRRTAWRPRLIVGADGRASGVRRQLGLPMLHDEPHNLLGGMLVDGVPEWPQDLMELGTEGGIHHLVFPQGGAKVRLYLCYGFEERQRFTGAGRERNLLDAFGAMSCLPLGRAIARGEPIGPFHSYSNEDHWVERPIAPGVVLIGDAAGHNDPITGQGTSITLRDVRIIRDIILAGDLSPGAFEPYVAERLERMRRLRVTSRLATTLRVEFGPDAAARRARALRRANVERWLSPLGAALAGPEVPPPEAFEQATIDALLADD
jgi:2-polyprenyl-6-methoxyphenol hydroxylase-like FAD-dependent oxidoreductase